MTRPLASGVRLYGGALVLHAVLGDALTVDQGIQVLAFVTLVYTLIGGIKAVVATDAIQVVVMSAATVILRTATVYANGGAISTRVARKAGSASRPVTNRT